jgi:hypothetical protein
LNFLKYEKNIKADPQMEFLKREGSEKSVFFDCKFGTNSCWVESWTLSFRLNDSMARAGYRIDEELHVTE